MKTFSIGLFQVLVVVIAAHGQVGIGTTNPNPHAVLELKSSGGNQGLIVPTMTTLQRTASSFMGSLGSAENGLLVYDSDAGLFYYWSGTAWSPLSPGSLNNTSVTPGTYGSATQVPQFVVDQQGRLTNVGNVTISGVNPVGAASGDLSGSFPSPLVAKLQGNAISSTAPTANQILKWNGTAWTPSGDANSGGTVTTVTAGTGLTGGPITTTGSLSLANTAVTPGTYGTSTSVGQFIVDGQGRITGATNVVITGAAPTGVAGGDLVGNFPNPTVAPNAINATKISVGDYSSKINSGTYSIAITGNAATSTTANSAITATNFSGTLAGDVIGTQGATSVSKLQGSAVSSTAPTANQILKWSGTAWTPSADANSGGTVTTVNAGTGLTGGPITGTGTLSLANTAVTAGTYGTSTSVGQFIVDAQGRITGASNVVITGAAPTGAAGGDLTGNFPNPTIATNAINATKISVGDYSSKINTGTYSIGISGNAATSTLATNFSGSLAGDVTGTQGATTVNKLQGSAVSSTAPATNQVMKWSGTAWTPTADANSGGTVTTVNAGTGLTGGPITGTGTLSLANTAVTAGTYGTSTSVGQFIVDAQGRITGASNVVITGAAPTGAAGGDLTGTFPNPTIATNAINATKMSSGDYSTKINTGTYSIGISGNAATATLATNFSGALAGDVTGTQGATVVSKLQGSAVSSTAPSTNQVMKWSGTAWTPTADANSGGTVTSVSAGTGLTGGPITGSGALSLANTTVTPGSYGSGTQVAQINVDAQGRITNASSVTITGAAPIGAASGDLTGSYPNPTVATGAGNNLLSAINNAATTATINTNRLNTGVVLDTESPAAGDITGSFGSGLQIGANAVTTAEIGNIAVTDAKIASGITAAKVAPSTNNGYVLTTVAGATAWAPNAGGPPSGAAGGDLTGTYPNPTIGVGKVTSTAILDGTIADVDIAGITTAGKVSGNAIIAGTIGGTTVVNTSGTITSSTGVSGNSTSGNAVTATTQFGTAVAATATDNKGQAMYAYNTNGGRAVWAYSPTGIALEGQSNTSYGVQAYSGTGTALYAHTDNTSGGYGVYGEASGTGGEVPSYGYGVYGKNTANSTYGYLGGNSGVYGFGNDGTGVQGDGGNGNGVLGTGYIGVYGYGSYYGGYFYGTTYGGYFSGGTWALYASGKAGGSQAWTVSSDRRFKKNIQPLTDPLNRVLRLRGVSYDWKRDEFPDRNFSDKKTLGFIAQEIKEVLPEVVSQDKDGYYSVSYESVVPVLVEAIKQQQTLIEQQKERIAKMEKDQADFAERLAQLESGKKGSSSHASSLTAKSK